MAVTETTSLVTSEEAEAYFAGRLHSDAWDSADEPTKGKALITATRQINALAFDGTKADPSQPHAFPRKFYVPAAMDASNRRRSDGMATEDGIQPYAKDATCEQAIFLLETTEYERHRARQQANGIIGGGAGKANEYANAEQIAKSQLGPRLSPAAYRILSVVLAKTADLA